MKTILTIQNIFFSDVQHEVKVTKINNKWHIRVFTNGIVNQEQQVKDRSLIGNSIKDMLRTEAKCGNYSKMADSSRHR